MDMQYECDNAFPNPNGLPVALRLTPVTHSALFLSSLEITLFDRGWTGSALE